ncbi:DUF4157 domain-containing protein [Kribbella sp. NPDC026611]|uniref:eCIS core domain-containing protein n=1 Tax=Kribbella sp. NPDC026611 TaxID=3154911 RepID=UPI00340963BA
MDATAERPDTLGERLARLAEYLRLRHVTSFAWAPGLATVLDRLDALDQSWAGRFERHENAEDWAPRRGAFPSAVAVPSPLREPEAVGEPEPQRLPVDVRARLREVAGPGVDHLQVRVDAEADAAARSQHADAVTVGTTVKVRSGKFRLDTPEGLGLLAHEASHVTALLARGAGTSRSTPDGIAAEEAVAARVERLAQRLPMGSEPVRPPDSKSVALSYEAHSVGRTNHLPAAPQARVDVPSAPPAMTPMRADADRAEAGGGPGPASFDAEGLRQGIVEELMRRLRTDSERGG